MDIQLDNMTMHYEVCGKGRPLLVLHGWSFDHHHMMTALEPCFRGRRGWQRIYLDMPGHGKTATTKEIQSMDEVFDRILQFVDKVIPGKRFVLAGMSTGAYLARGIILKRFPLVDGLLMIVPRIMADDDQRTLPPPVTLVEDPELLAKLGEQEANALKGAVVQSRQLLNSLRKDVQPAWARTDWELLQQLWQPDNWALSFDVDALPEPMPAPTLILTGRQDAIVGYQDALPLLEQYPRATFAVLDRAGHTLEIDQKPLVQALVNEWLNRVEEVAARF